jgi:hypothetical protein
MPISQQTLSRRPRFAVETHFLETPFLETMYSKRFIIQ